MLHHTSIGPEHSSGMVYRLTLEQKGPCTSKLRVLVVQKHAAVLVLFPLIREFKQDRAVIGSELNAGLT